MNAKAKGEKGQRIVIGELAKLDLDVAIPLSDNLPWDFIVVYKNRLLKAQVKSSQTTHKSSQGSIVFGLRSNNWHAKTIRKYTINECDIMFLCDFQHVYVLGPNEFQNRNSFVIRTKSAHNGQQKDINFHNDYLLTLDRLEKCSTFTDVKLEQNLLGGVNRSPN